MTVWHWLVEALVLAPLFYIAHRAQRSKGQPQVLERVEGWLAVLVAGLRLTLTLQRAAVTHAIAALWLAGPAGSEVATSGGNTVLPRNPEMPAYLGNFPRCPAALLAGSLKELFPVAGLIARPARSLNHESGRFEVRRERSNAQICGSQARLWQ